MQKVNAMLGVERAQRHNRSTTQTKSMAQTTAKTFWNEVSHEAPMYDKIILLEK